MKPRTALVQAAVVAELGRHPELSGPTIEGVTAALIREGIVLVRQERLPRNADGATFQLGAWVSIGLRIGMERDRELWVMLHELGHVRLHTHDRALTESWRQEYRAGESTEIYDALEAEADAFADALLNRAETNRPDTSIVATGFARRCAPGENRRTQDLAPPVADRTVREGDRIRLPDAPKYVGNNGSGSPATRSEFYPKARSRRAARR